MTTAHHPATRRYRSPLAAALIGALLLTAACGGTAEEAAAGPEAEDAEVAAAADQLAASTFDTEAVTVGGEAYDLSQLAGSDLVLWFWAPW